MSDSHGPPLTRRAMIVGGAAAVLGACTSGSNPAAGPGHETATTATTTPAEATTTTTISPVDSPEYAGPNPFTLGVASGDPDETSVVLWTRLLPDGTTESGGPDHMVALDVAESPTFDVLISSETVTAPAEHGHSVHHIAADLEPDSWYWFRFRIGEHVSAVGATRTTPRLAEPSELRFGFSSCQNWESGAFGAHRQLAELDLDLFVWLGDYIYEYGPSDQGVLTAAGPRVHVGDETQTLDDYRARYAQYRSDPHLQAHHAARPWIVTWDDHEVDNNHTGLISEDGQTLDTFTTRRNDAYQAWWEHMPVRIDPPTPDGLRVHRTIEWGGLAAFHMLDGRQYRDDQPNDGEEPSILAGVGIQTLGPTALDPDHSMLGADQEDWLIDQLAASGTRWNVLGNQVYMHGVTALPGSPAINPDSWDGYHANRERLLNRVNEVLSEPIVVLTGDFHAGSIARLHTDPFDPSSPIVGTELMAPAISSQFPERLRELAPIAIAFNPQVEHFDPANGYITCTVTQHAWTATMHTLADVTDELTGIAASVSFDITDAGPIPSDASA